MTKKTGHVPSTFTDAGTGETFEGGKDHLIETGAYANYEAAGLVHAPAPKAQAAPARAARKSRSKAASKPVAAPAAETSGSDAAPNA